MDSVIRGRLLGKQGEALLQAQISNYSRGSTYAALGEAGGAQYLLMLLMPVVIYSHIHCNSIPYTAGEKHVVDAQGE